jgi:signal transduction histidine kinase
MKKPHYLLLCLFICPILLSGQSTTNLQAFELHRDSQVFHLTQNCEIFKDSTCQIRFDQLQQAYFTPLPPTETLNQPLSATYWLRFKIKNKDSVAIQRFVNIYQRAVEKAQLFVLDEKGVVNTSPVIGAAAPFGTQTIPTQSLNFVHNFEAQKTYTLYLYLDQRDLPLITSINLYSTPDVLPLKMLHQSGILVGISFCYACLAFIMFWFMRQPLYFSYLLYTTLGVGYLVATTSMGYEFVWSNFGIFESVSDNVFGFGALSGFLLIAIYFFDTVHNFPKSDKVLKAIIGVSVCFIIIAIFRKSLPLGTYYLAFIVAGISVVVAIVFVLAIAIYSFYTSRRKEAFFYLVGFSSFFCLFITTLLTEMGFTVFRHWAHYVLPLVTLFFEFTILLGILAYRLKEEWVQIKLNEIQLRLNIVEQRQRISRDLHDNVGSTLNSISVFSEIARQQIQHIHPEASPLLERIGEASRDLVTTINDIVWAVNPKNDQFENIVLRMRLFAADLLVQKNVLIDFQEDENLNTVNLNIEQRKHFYLIFKEAINNIYKYAECTSVNINLELCESAICITIADNGRGFDLANPKNGNGLQTMQERAKILRGVLTIDSVLEKGTRVFLSFPIENKIENKKTAQRGSAS